MSNIFMMNEEIAHGMVCFFHQKKHSYLISMSKTAFVYFSLKVDIFWMQFFDPSEFFEPTQIVEG
jgi:hypothetical protein